jgi:hypothetical protein
MARIKDATNRTCIVCGHSLGPYGRICDKCGSIQRPTKGDGLALPPDKFKPCERCGEPIPIEEQTDLCENCATEEEIPQVVWVEDEDPHKKARRTAQVLSGVTLASAVGLGLSIIFAGAQVVLIVLLCIAAVAFGASVASWIIISRMPAMKIEHYPSIKQEKQLPLQR